MNVFNHYLGNPLGALVHQEQESANFHEPDGIYHLLVKFSKSLDLIPRHLGLNNYQFEPKNGVAEGHTVEQGGTDLTRVPVVLFFNLFPKTFDNVVTNDIKADQNEK